MENKKEEKKEENKSEENKSEENKSEEIKEKPKEKKEIKREKSIAEQGTELLQGMEKQNKIFAENLKKAQEMNYQNMMGGSSRAGRTEKTEDEKITESAKALLKDTGFEDMI
tara:strand:+ start:2646 stop:2981 length:336 start_codon:yes stop_codon:yes gene_type:complete